jgi:hypothetical protein
MNSKKIPDGAVLRTVAGKAVIVFNPRWWRLDRWLFWAWVVVARRPRGVAGFSMIVGSGLVEKFDLPVYETRR